MFRACEKFLNGRHFAHTRLDFHVGIKIRFKVKKCVSQYFQTIVSRVGNDLNRLTVQLQRCEPRLDQNCWIVHSIIKRHLRSISTLQFIDSVLQSSPLTDTNQFMEVLSGSWNLSISRVFPIAIIDRGIFLPDTFTLLHLLRLANFSNVSSSPEISSMGQYTLASSSLWLSAVLSTSSERTWRVERRWI